MIRRFVAVVVAIGAAVSFSASPSSQGRGGQRSATERINGREVVSGEVLVKFNRALPGDELAQIGALADADSLSRIGRTGIRRVRSRSLSAAALLARFAGRDDI